MSMYNLLEYSDNYLMTSESLWSYCEDEVNNVANENNGDNFRIYSNKTATSKSFEYETKILDNAPTDSNIIHRICGSIKIFN